MPLLWQQPVPYEFGCLWENERRWDEGRLDRHCPDPPGYVFYNHEMSVDKQRVAF